MAKRKATNASRRAPQQATAAATVAAEVVAKEPAVDAAVEVHHEAPAAVPESASAAEPVAHAASEHARQAAFGSKKHARTLDVFLIDSGWNNPICSAVRENLPAVAGYLKGHRFFVLSQEKSLEFVQSHPVFIGADPLLLVLDPHAAAKKDSAGCGFRLSLGHVRNPEVAISMLKWAMQLTMTASMSEMANLVRKSGHRETFQGVIELVGESAHLLEFAPI